METFCRFRFQNIILIISLPDTTIKYWGCSARIDAFVNSDNIYIYYKCRISFAILHLKEENSQTTWRQKSSNGRGTCELASWIFMEHQAGTSPWKSKNYLYEIPINSNDRCLTHPFCWLNQPISTRFFCLPSRFHQVFQNGGCFWCFTRGLVQGGPWLCLLICNLTSV